MKLLLDENLSRRLLPALQGEFPESSQVALLGLEQADDRGIWEYAKVHGYVIVTKDDDFHDLQTVWGYPAGARQQLEQGRPGSTAECRRTTAGKAGG